MNSDQIMTFMIAFLIISLIFPFTKIIKLVFRFILNTILGISFLMLSNLILKSTGLFIGINPITSIFSGILGAPGVICLYILKSII